MRAIRHIMTIVAVMAIMLITAGIARADVDLVIGAPAATNVLVQQIRQGGSYLTEDIADPPSLFSRGQTFLMPDAGVERNGFNVSSIMVRTKGDQTPDTGDYLRLWVFQYTGNTDWTNGDQSADEGSDPLAETGMTALSTEVDGDAFALGTSEILNGSSLRFDFSPPLYMAQNTEYAYLLQFINGSGDGLDRFSLNTNKSNDYPNGVRLDVNGTTHSTNAKDFTFWVSGVAKPPQSTVVSVR